MLTVVAATAIGRSCLDGNKADIESGAVAVVVVGEYSIIELRIRMAIIISKHLFEHQNSDSTQKLTHLNLSLGPFQNRKHLCRPPFTRHVSKMAAPFEEQNPYIVYI